MATSPSPRNISQCSLPLLRIISLGFGSVAEAECEMPPGVLCCIAYIYMYVYALRISQRKCIASLSADFVVVGLVWQSGGRWLMSRVVAACKV